MDISKQIKALVKWNRKIHIYLGLFLLLFIWLLGLSGLLLNHHWAFANSWERRKEMSYDTKINISKERQKQLLVQEIMDKLNLQGSIINLRYASDSLHLNFIATKPGTRYDIQAELADGQVSIKKTTYDQWNIMRSLHKIRNPTLQEQAERYPSTLASVWSLSLDIVSVGLIIICLGGWYMLLQITGKRFYFGLASLSAGIIISIYLLLF